MDILIIPRLTLLRQSFIFSRPPAFVNVPTACAGFCFVADIFMNAVGDRHTSEMQLLHFTTNMWVTLVITVCSRGIEKPNEKCRQHVL